MPGAARGRWEELLRLLGEDEEFRYAVAGLLGLDEILRRLDSVERALLALQEQVRTLQEQVKSLQEQVSRHTRAIEEMASTIHAIGARDGASAGGSPRETMRCLLDDLLKVYRVSEWVYHDREGLVYGNPSTVEAMILVRNNEHVIVKHKLLADRADVAELHKIGILYEKATGVKPKLLLVALAIRRRARELAERLGIETRGEVIEP